jgi:hypothetical protein
LNSLLKNLNFRWGDWLIWVVLALLFALHMLWSFFFPLANVETYYWDWSRKVGLGYFDHPGAIAWVGAFFNFILPFPQIHLERISVPMINLLTTLYLIKSFLVIHTTQGKIPTRYHVLFLILVINIIPLFATQSFLLMPDGLLFFCCAATQYYALRVATHQNKDFKYYILLIIFGAFAGLGFNAKYHMGPLFAGLILGIAVYKNLSFFQLTKLIGFLSITFFIFAFPTLYWNYSNEFISFLFQLDHGFGGGTIDLTAPIRSQLEGLGYYSPVVFFLSFYVSYQAFFKKEEGWKNISIVCIVPFLCVFFLFFTASFIKYPQPYWNSCGFLMMVPLIISEFFLSETQKFKPIYKKLTLLCIYAYTSISFIVISLVCIKPVRMWISEITEGRVGYQLFIWDYLNEESIAKYSSFTVPKSASHIPYCKKGEYLVGSLDWTWTSQLANNFHDRPYLYDFQYENPSWYSFRDNIYQMEGCQVFIIARNEMARPTLEDILDIETQKVFYIPPFLHLPLTVIIGKIDIKYR